MGVLSKIVTELRVDQDAALILERLKQFIPSDDQLADPDRTVAWEVYVELRTRITTQKLRYHDGDESSALQSLYTMFSPCRELLRTYGADCRRTAALVTYMLNHVLRPVTSEWHRRKLAGDFARDDACRDFRAQLEEVRGELIVVERLLYAIATDSTEKPPHLDDDDFTSNSGESIPFDRLLGLPNARTPKAAVEAILTWERCEILERRAEAAKEAERKAKEAVCKAEVEAAKAKEAARSSKPAEVEAAEAKAAETKAVAAARVAAKARRKADSIGNPTSDDETSPACHDLVGLAISGGGIRSATYSLGVLQTLVQFGMLKHVDVISTVSGGGYVGAFLSSILNTSPTANAAHGKKKKKSRTEHPSKETTDRLPPKCSLDKAHPPFKPEIAGDSRAIRELRNHSRYIVPASFVSWALAVGQAAYGVVSNVIILSSLVFAGVLVTAGLEGEVLTDMYSRVLATESLPKSVWVLSKTTTAVWSVSLAMLLTLPFTQRLGRSGGKSETISYFWERITACAFGLSLLMAGIEYLPLAHYGYLLGMHQIGDWLKTAGLLESTSPDGWSLKATFIALFNLGGLIAARSEWISTLGSSYPKLQKAIFSMLWMAGPALFVYAYFELCRVYVAAHPSSIFLFGSDSLSVSPIMFMYLLLGLSLAYSTFINVNFTSLHRYYRNRLAETYLLRQEPDTSVRSAEASSRKPVQQKLSNMRATADSAAPYHLINAAMNLPSSNLAELRGRDCDFFLFSKHYCGSPIQGYQPTRRWENQDPHLDLGTAIAISGAAAAPQMGMGSIKGASFLLTLLNVRLGYWLRRPADATPEPLPGDKSPKSQRWLSAPGPFYLLREAFNWMDHNSSYLNLSDGGHLENLGVYELLRRRCKYIIAIDGECDPDLECPSLMRLQQFAKVDFDIDIEMDIERLRWIELIPAEDTPHDDEKDADAIVRPVRNRTRFSRGHFAVGRVHYPTDPVDETPVTGWLIYVKLSITGNETDYIKDYRRRFPDAPHQSTADQVFEEDQFEAYRRLGEHAAKDLFLPELIGTNNRKSADAGTLDIKDWFEGITSNFFRNND
jgi:hypothetical protein